MIFMMARSSLVALVYTTSAGCLADVPAHLGPPEQQRLAIDQASMMRWRAVAATRGGGPGNIRGIAATPLLDGQLADYDLASLLVRRRSYGIDFGELALGIEMLRLQPVRAGRFGDDRADVGVRKSWSFGIRSDWPISGRDRLSLGLANGTYRSLLPGDRIHDPRHSTTLRTFEMSWTHDQRWQLGWGLQENSGRLRGPRDHMLQLAGGPPVHGNGMSASLTFMPDGDADPHRNSISIEARRDLLAPDNSGVRNATTRQDVQARLSIKTRF